MPTLLTAGFSHKISLTITRGYGCAKEVERFMWCQLKYKQPRAVLNNYHEMPIIGLGTWLSPKGCVAEAVKTAIDAGYRHIDCAYIYQNENEVGSGIEAKLKEGVVKRKDLFITSKLWNTFHRPDLVRNAFEASMDALKVDYLDLYLMHWPMAYKEGCDLFPTTKDGKIKFSNVDYLDTWKEMEKLVTCGLAKSIGVSNFNRKQVERLLDCAKIRPVTNQIECHPYLNQTKLGGFCKTWDICITAYSPLGAPKRPWAKEGDPVILKDPKIAEIAKNKKKTPGQILVRYQVQRGNVCIPKSITKQHIEENINVFDFKLDDKEMEQIDSFDCGGRLIPLLNEAGAHKYYPFHEKY